MEPVEKNRLGSFSINPDRIVAFSDSVFAFAITLLVLKIDLPNVPKYVLVNQLPTVLASLWPQILANIISFAVIGYYWINHHRLFNHIKKYNMTLVWLNILLLMAISFIPFTTDLLGDFFGNPTAVIIYAGMMAATGFLQLGLWLYVTHDYQLIDKNVNKTYLRYHTLKGIIPPVIFLLSIPVTLIDPHLAKFFWILIIIFLLLIGITNKNLDEKYDRQLEKGEEENKF